MNRANALAKGRTTENRTIALEAVQNRKKAWAESVRDPIDLCVRKGASSLKQVAECLNLKGVRTSRGGEWSPTQVSRAMKLLDIRLQGANN